MGGQGGCDRRIEVLGKIHKKFGGGVGSGWGGGQGGCECTIEVFVKIQKTIWGGVQGGSGLGGGVMVDVNGELKFL